MAERIRVQPGMDFQFDPNRRVFLLGTKPQVEFPPDQINDMELHAGANAQAITGREYLTLTLFREVVEHPELRRKMAIIAKDAETRRELMEAVLESMGAKDYPRRDPERTTQALTDGAISISEIDGSGTFRLQTHGACACFRPDRMSMSVNLPPGVNWREDLSIPIGYSMHNAVTSRPRTDLLIGAGTVVWFAKQISVPNGVRS